MTNTDRSGTTCKRPFKCKAVAKEMDQGRNLKVHQRSAKKQKSQDKKPGDDSDIAFHCRWN